MAGSLACGTCGRTGRCIESHGWCTACNSRWRYNGKPAFGPPQGPAERRADFAELRGWGASMKEAARRIGVSVRTAWQTREQVTA